MAPSTCTVRFDRVRKRKTGATKTETARRIPIEPALRPLLEAIYIEARGHKSSSKAVTGPLLRMPSVGVLSSKLKFYLRQAGIERADLHSRDETRKAMTFHDLRATGITWMAVRGDDCSRSCSAPGTQTS